MCFPGCDCLLWNFYTIGIHVHPLRSVLFLSIIITAYMKPVSITVFPVLSPIFLYIPQLLSCRIQNLYT